MARVFVACTCMAGSWIVVFANYSEWRSVLATSLSVVAGVVLLAVATDAAVGYFSGRRGRALVADVASMLGAWAIVAVGAFVLDAVLGGPDPTVRSVAPVLWGTGSAVVAALVLPPVPLAVVWVVTSGLFSMSMTSNVFAFESTVWFRVLFAVCTLAANGMIVLAVRRARLSNRGPRGARIALGVLTPLAAAAYATGLAVMPTWFTAAVLSLSLPDNSMSIGRVVAESLGITFGMVYIGALLPAAAAMLAVGRRQELAGLLAARTERERLNRDAHDRVYNRLTALANRLTASDSPAADDIRNTVADLQSILGDAQVATQTTARPLVSLFIDLAEDVENRWGMVVELVGSDALADIGPQLGWELLCIAEEALANAGRHGKASRTTVEISRHEGDLVLAITDDGSGVVLGADGLPAGARGIAGIAERARLLGGTLKLERGADDGMVVRVTVPVA